MDLGVLLLRVVHIASGVFWVGAAFTFLLFVAPSANALEPRSTKRFMDEITARRRFPTIILAANILTIVAGALLYWRASGGLNPSWIGSPTGIGFTIGALAAIGSFVIGGAMIAPTIHALESLGNEIEAAGRPPTPEEGARFGELNQRLRTVGAVDLVLLGVAVVMMAIARYLGG